MNRNGNPIFVKGNTLGRLARGKPKRTLLRHLLERFVPDVVNVIQDRLGSQESDTRWDTTKELLPYLFRRKGVEQQDAEVPEPVSLQDYLQAKQTQQQAETGDEDIPA